jgi:hypothetical protein
MRKSLSKVIILVQPAGTHRPEVKSVDIENSLLNTGV